MSLRDIQMICMVEEVKTTVSLSNLKSRSMVIFFTMKQAQLYVRER